jgi:two-component system, cell cycle sensor histidine kinase and response regulator CckA
MTANEWKSLHPWSISFKIVALYATVGVLWILFSDTLLDALVKDHATVTRISILKGWLYVLVTAALLFLLISRYVAMIQRNEEALRESEKRYFTLFEKSHSAVLLIDPETSDILDANAKACIFYGYDKETLTRMKIGDINTLGTEIVSSEIEMVSSGRKSLLYFTHRLASGELRDVEVHSAPIVLQGNKVLYSIIHDISDRRKAERELKESEEQYRKLSREFQALLDAIPDDIVSLSPDMKIRWVNRVTSETLGKETSDLVGNCCHSFWYGRSEPCEECPAQESLRSGKLESGIVRSPDGRTFELRSVPIRDKNGTVVSVVELGRDITEMKRMEERLLQSHKMEAVGRLAGGVAHDFNNLLTVIMGYAEHLLSRLGEDDPHRKEVEEIRKAGNRAAALTGQLLAFSRRQVLQPEVLDLNRVVQELETMLRRLIGENMDLATSLDAGHGNVKVDPGQIEQVVVNLVVNARDAMPGGGKVMIRTTNVILDGEAALGEETVPSGSYVLLEISDTGCGMDPSTIAQIFDPFFTTKEKGKGTGLGLATVYGIVRQSGGHILVSSESGKGTTFHIYFPRIEESSAEPKRVPECTPATGGQETVLLVEDSEELRELVREILERNGYNVLEASQGSDAILVCSGHEGAIHLILTDVVMPGMSGRELCTRLTPLYPGVKVIYMSGYTDDTIGNHGVLEPGTVFIQKPFSPNALERKVREVLDTGRDT